MLDTLPPLWVKPAFNVVAPVTANVLDRDVALPSVIAPVDVPPSVIVPVVEASTAKLTAPEAADLTVAAVSVVAATSTNVALPAAVTNQLPALPVISLPVPELVSAINAPAPAPALLIVIPPKLSDCVIAKTT